MSKHVWCWFFVVLIGFCLACHPSTSVDAIGYHNVGFEKQVSLRVVTPDGGSPLAIDLNHDGKADSYVWELDVVNDAAKAYEYNGMIVNRVADLIEKGVDAFIAYQTGKANAPAEPAGPSKLDQIKALLADPEVRSFIDSLRGGTP